MYSDEKEVGNTTISPQVLQKIARLTALSVQGVSRLANTTSGLSKMLSKVEDKGAIIRIQEEGVFVDVYVVLLSSFNVRDVCREIQSRVSRAISEMVGLDVGGVTVHVMDFDFNV
ncbi:MAG: Asp23/Gls24 family envelope stress response protein [Anaerolineaceae bacterium]|nr:Asp23/Gls24 family envelope stress response protein [Anaerolineaceae bacterium]